MTPTTTPARAFLEAVLNEPDEDAHRLVFADWLEEHDDPRGEFIRLQCQLEHLNPDDPRRPACSARERQLRHAHGREWAGTIARLAGGYFFRRGFVERVRLDGKSFFTHAPAVFRLAPVRELELTASPDELARLTDHPVLARLTSLELVFHGQDSDALAEFFDSPHLAGLTRLKVRSPGTSAAAALASSRHLRRLTTLDLGGYATGTGIEALIGARSLTGLSRLCLYSAGLDDEAARLLAAAPLLRSLNALDLRYNDLGPSGALALASSPFAEQLTTLALGYNRVGDRGLVALANSPWLPALARLYLSQNGLDGRGVKMLANAPLASNLTHLDLDYNDLSSESLLGLAASPRLRRLQTLFVRCGLGMTAAVRQTFLSRFGAGVCKW